MIPYIEIRDKYTLKTLTLVEPQECWFELSYQDVGECEIYCRASLANLKALQKGRYVTLPNKRFIWVITAIQYIFTESGTRMISARGYEAKWILKKRCILTPKELQGTITNAVYGLVDLTLGATAEYARAILDENGNQMLFTDTNSIAINVEDTQAPRGNLLEYITNLLKIYGCGHIITLDNGILKYTVFKGVDRSQSVKFSQSLDNLLSSEYLTDDTDSATYAMVVSTVATDQADGSTKDVEYTAKHNHGVNGIDRAEIVAESNLSTKYEDANGVEQETTPDSALYRSWLVEEVKNKLAEHTTIEEISGKIDIVNSNYEFDRHFFLGDTVRAQDEYFDFYVNPKITKYTYKQDAEGYGEDAQYGE